MPNTGRRPSRRGQLVLFTAHWGDSLRVLSLCLWGACLVAALLNIASQADWISTGDDGLSLLGGQALLLLITLMTDSRRRRHIMRILRDRETGGYLIETNGLFGRVQRFVPIEEAALIELGAPDMHGVMTLRLPGQLSPYRVDTDGEELDIGLNELPAPVRR